MEEFIRTEKLIGKEKMNILKNAHILVVGVGGVGGYACEMLARSGIGNLTIVDDDFVAESNLNRQIIALNSTIGEKKIEVMKKRISDINPDCKVDSKFLRFNEENSNKIFDNAGYDFVVDAIDSLNEKALLVSDAKKRNLKIVSALGAGNRYNIPSFKIVDIYDTYNDGLARKFRKLLREKNVENLSVVFSEEKPIFIDKDEENKNKFIGSIVYSPAMCGCVLTAYVINELIK